MREVVFSRLYRVRVFLGILAVAPCNINVTRIMELENSWLYSDILVDERCSICRLQSAATWNARERRQEFKVTLGKRDSELFSKDFKS